MNTIQTPAGPQWRKQKARIMLMFSELTNSDFLYEYGKKEDMMINLQNKLGKSRSELNELFTHYKEKKS